MKNSPESPIPGGQTEKKTKINSNAGNTIRAAALAGIGFIAATDNGVAADGRGRVDIEPTKIERIAQTPRTPVEEAYFQAAKKLLIRKEGESTEDFRARIFKHGRKTPSFSSGFDFGGYDIGEDYGTRRGTRVRRSAARPDEFGVFYIVSPRVSADIALYILQDEQIARDLARDVVAYSSTFHTDPRAAHILIRAAEISGDWQMLTVSLELARTAKMPWTREVAMRTAEHYPRILFSYPEAFNGNPPAGVLEGLAEKYPDDAIRAFPRYRAFDNSRTVLTTAFEKADPSNVLYDLVLMLPQLPKNEHLNIFSVIPQKIGFAVALLAYDLTPNYKSLLKDPSLKDAPRIDRTLLFPLVQKMRAPGFQWRAIETQFSSRGTSDFPNVADVKLVLMRELLKRYDGRNPVEVEDAAGYIARNLFNKNIPAENEQVTAEVQKVLSAREAVKNEDIFQNDVLVVSHVETHAEASGVQAKGEKRFGRAELIEQLRSRMPAGAALTHIYPATTDSAPNAKKETLDAIETSKRPLTLYFDGHGDAAGMYLSSGEVVNGVVREAENATKITPDEFASALAKRWHAKSEDNKRTGSDVNLVLSACFMQDYMRALIDKLRILNVPVPRFVINASEFGQFSYSEFTESMGAKFNRLIATSPNIGEVVTRGAAESDANPSIFIQDPEDEHRLMQISGTVLPRTVA